jgi:hypothetical protein
MGKRTTANVVARCRRRRPRRRRSRVAQATVIAVVSRDDSV